VVEHPDRGREGRLSSILTNAVSAADRDGYRKEESARYRSKDEVCDATEVS
jgi:hypothetical protein